MAVVGGGLDGPVAGEQCTDNGGRRGENYRQSFCVHLRSVDPGGYAPRHTNRWGLPERKSEVRCKSGAVSQL